MKSDLVQSAAEHQIGYAKGKRGSEFVVLANFGLRLIKYVTAPKELPKESGFVVEVTQKRHYHTTCSGSSEVLKGWVARLLRFYYLWLR